MKIADWISDRVNDSPTVRYLALPLVLFYLVPLLCAASLLHGWSDTIFRPVKWWSKRRAERDES